MYQGRSRRSVLTFFAALANLYLLGFALDASISVIDDAIRLAGWTSPLLDVRNGVASVVALASFVMALVVLFVPQLPRLVLLPPVVFAIWAAFGAPPLAIAETTGPILSVLQLALALGAFVLINFKFGRWFLSAAQLPVKRHMLLRTLAALAVVILIAPALLGSGLVVAFAKQLELRSDRYVQFNAGGVDVQETQLSKGKQNIYLIGMMHIGEASAYDALFASLPEHALVFPEGVSDSKNLLVGKFSYRRVAKVLGLEQQPNIADVESAQSPAEQKPEPASQAAPDPITQGGRTFLRADVDVSDFAPVTLRFLTDLGEIYASATLSDAIKRFQTLSKAYSEADVGQVFDDILTKRNAHLIKSFDANNASYDTVVIPWGALHMPGIEQALRERGYMVKERKTIPLLRYQTLIKALSKH